MSRSLRLKSLFVAILMALAVVVASQAPKAALASSSAMYRPPCWQCGA